MSGFKRAMRIIGMVWVVAMIAALPYAFFTQIHYVDRPINSGNFLMSSAFCAMLPANIYPKVIIIHITQIKKYLVNLKHYNFILSDKYFSYQIDKFSVPRNSSLSKINVA